MYIKLSEHSELRSDERTFVHVQQRLFVAFERDRVGLYHWPTAAHDDRMGRVVTDDGRECGHAVTGGRLRLLALY